MRNRFSRSGTSKKTALIGLITVGVLLLAAAISLGQEGPNPTTKAAVDSSGTGPPPPAPTPVVTVSGPKSVKQKKAKKKRVVLNFSSTVPGTTFQCSLDGRPPTPCSSPFTTPGLKPGKHSFVVQATGPTGVASVPATFSFKVIHKKKKHKKK